MEKNTWSPPWQSTSPPWDKLQRLFVRLAAHWWSSPPACPSPGGIWSWKASYRFLHHASAPPFEPSGYQSAPPRCPARSVWAQAMLPHGAMTWRGEKRHQHGFKRHQKTRFGTMKAMEQTVNYPNYPFRVLDWLVLMSPKVLCDKCGVCNQGLVSGNDAFGILAPLSDG